MKTLIMIHDFWKFVRIFECHYKDQSSIFRISVVIEKEIAGGDPFTREGCGSGENLVGDDFFYNPVQAWKLQRDYFQILCYFTQTA